MPQAVSVCTCHGQGSLRRMPVQEDSKRGQTYLRNKIFLLNLCLHEGLSRDDSSRHLSSNTAFFQINLGVRAISLTSSPRHHDDTSVQPSVYQRGHGPTASPAWKREKLAQDPSPWLSLATDQEGDQLRILNKQEQTGPKGERQSSSF